MPDTNSIITSVPDQYQIMLDNYASIVEKTNNHLNMWFNPYGLMVGILTLLVAVAAIVVSVILWKNSEEQKKRIKDFFDEQDKIIKERNEKDDERREVAKKEFEELIREQQNKLKLAKKQNKKEIEKFINELKKEKASLDKHSSQNFALADYPTFNISQDRVSFHDIGQNQFYGFNKKSTICSKCGKSFDYYDDPPYKAYATLDSGIVYCSHCGEKNIKK